MSHHDHWYVPGDVGPAVYSSHSRKTTRIDPSSLDKGELRHGIGPDGVHSDMV